LFETSEDENIQVVPQREQIDIFELTNEELYPINEYSEQDDFDEEYNHLEEYNPVFMSLGSPSGHIGRNEKFLGSIIKRPTKLEKLPSLKLIPVKKSKTSALDVFKASQKNPLKIKNKTEFMNSGDANIGSYIKTYINTKIYQENDNYSGLPTKLTIDLFVQTNSKIKKFISPSFKIMKRQKITNSVTDDNVTIGKYFSFFVEQHVNKNKSSKDEIDWYGEDFLPNDMNGGNPKYFRQD
jgi:hypothetical protein